MIKLMIAATGMFGFGFAMVPFYKAICEATGVNQLDTGRGEVVNTQTDMTRVLRMEFTASTNQNMPWQFEPVDKSVKVHPGELKQVMFVVKNKTNHAITGRAIPSYGPQLAGRYFKKLECFCFTNQTLAPGEERQMPVVFVIDPAIPAEINTVTLSYTFFDISKAPGKL